MTLAKKYEGKEAGLFEAAVQAGLLESTKATKENMHMYQTIQDLARVDITNERINEVLTCPSDFGYFDNNDEMFVTWSLGPVYRTRDSNLREESNADALDKALEEAVEMGLFSDDDYYTTSCNHWAVGWVDHLSFRAIMSEETRKPTVIFMWLTRWFNALEDYPVADDEDFSRREWEYAEEVLGDMDFRVVAPRVYSYKDADSNRVYTDNLDVNTSEPDDWKSQVLSKMTELPTENYWNEDEAKRIAHELGYLACSECEGDGWLYNYDRKQMLLIPDKHGREYEYEKCKCMFCDGTGIEPPTVDESIKHTHDKIQENKQS